MRTILFLMVVLSGCHSPTKNDTNNDNNHSSNTNVIPTVQSLAQQSDPFSFSNHKQVKVTHLELDLKVKFKQKILEGFAIISFEKIDKDANQLILDSRDLKIKRIETAHTAKEKKLIWRYGQTIDGLGTAIIIDLPKEITAVKVTYETAPQASGLQWLSTEQTSDKKQPFLFSQSQAIHARSWIPLQDSPSVRTTYQATIRVKPELTVVMSADNNNQNSEDGVYTFTMQQAIPAYLIAIAAGDLQSKQISEHVSIYAEQSVLAAAAYEFAETENMISATEKLYGPYRWGQYDLLILPPSFPFGGMENPKLSFITPTVIAGDRSLDSLIAHELAHSWSGNLVTNALWQDAWLNEGFTSYIESRIIDAIYGKERMKMEATLTYQALLNEMSELPEDQQKLINPVPASDPDIYFSAVAYDKGRFFLEWLEHQVGRTKFDQFLNTYFNHFAFQSITSSQFLNFLDKHLLSQKNTPVHMEQINQWMNEPGLPDFFTPPVTNRFKTVDEAVNQWLNGKVSAQQLKTSQWTTQEWLHFLRALPAKLSTTQLDELDSAFAFNQIQNSEIAHDWLLIGINNQYQAIYPRLIEYLSSIGRVKLIKPLYEALMQQSELHNLANNIYLKARPGYHNIAINQIDEILNHESNN